MGDGTYSVNYAYVPNSSLVDTVTFKQGTTTRMTTQRRFDYLGRLQSIVNTPAGAGQLPASYAYQYNQTNQRTQMTLADGSFWAYRYDALGQVTSGKRYWNDGGPVPGQQFEYGFDDIGNRNSTKSGGDANGANLRSATYTPNLLNQYTQRTVPGSFDILGLATAANSVTVNSAAVDYRHGEYFQKNVIINNASSALWQAITTTAGTTTTTGNLFVAQTPEVPTYDLDGNLFQDGRWIYTWDGENRLIGMESLSAAPSASKRKLTFEYDDLGRRIGKKVYVWTGSAYPASPNTTLKFLYDGWNLLAEFDAGNSIVRSYQWGLDLSGSIQGAGGVGGLLSVRTAGGTAQFIGYDGNGNVTIGVDGGTGSQVFSFEYGPFGEPIRSSGQNASTLMFQFSSKCLDRQTGLVYYGFRYYNPTIGRWISRDPLGEVNGNNNFGFVSNSPLDVVDQDGRAAFSFQIKRIKDFLAADDKDSAADEALGLYQSIYHGSILIH